MAGAVVSEGRGEAPVPLPSRWAGAAFDGQSQSISEARQFAADYLARLRDVHGVLVSAGGVGTVQLVVSELVTNALKYAPGPCLLDLELVGDSVEITVWDSSLALPTLAPPEPHRVGRHGLEIVTALSEAVRIGRTPVGKRITARVVVVSPQR